MDVQNRVSQALGRLPDTVKNTGVIITKQLGGFVFGAGVYTENGQYDSLFLSNYLDIYVKDAIKRVPGVGDAIIFGERKYAMRLWLDPARMAQRGLTATTCACRAARAKRAGRGRRSRATTVGQRAGLSKSACAPSAG